MNGTRALREAAQSAIDGGAQPRPPGIAERLAELVGGASGQWSIFGQAVEYDGVTIIPVARSRWGFGGGSGSDGAEGPTGSGGGGGANVRPVGFIEIIGGRARFRRIVDPGTVAAVLLTAIVFGFLTFRRRRVRSAPRQAPPPERPGSPERDATTVRETATSASTP